MKIFHFLILLLFPTFSFSQNYFSACKEIPLELGAGFDITNPVELKQKAFESSVSVYDEESAETSISYTVIHNHREFQKQLEVWPCHYGHGKEDLHSSRWAALQYYPPIQSV